MGGYSYFYGTLSDVQVATDDDEFNGTDGSFIPLDFTDPPPWIGAAVVLTTDSAPWFSNEWTETETGGGITGWFVPVTLKADINSDNKVNLVDFAILAGQWQQAPGQQSADIYPSGGDGIVNLLDLGVLCDYWPALSVVQGKSIKNNKLCKTNPISERLRRKRSDLLF